MTRKVRICKNKQCSIVHCKLVKVKAPASGRTRGFRYVAVVPNTGRYDPKTDTNVTSFRPQYYVAWVGDYQHPTVIHTQQFETALKGFPIYAQQILWSS
jgi:hypothetical protein